MILFVGMLTLSYCFFFFKQKTAYEMRISDWSSDVCSSDLQQQAGDERRHAHALRQPRGALDDGVAPQRKQHQAEHEQPDCFEHGAISNPDVPRILPALRYGDRPPTSRPTRPSRPQHARTPPAVTCTPPLHQTGRTHIYTPDTHTHPLHPRTPYTKN